MVNLKQLILVLFLISALVPAAIALQKTFTVQETDLVNVLPTAFDPDEEEVSYSFKPPLNSSGQWQTGYDDHGEYGLDITATDGVTTTTERIILIVKNLNRAPELEDIFINVKEGEIISLDLPKQDTDGDLLTYQFEDPFNQKGEWVTTYNDAGEYSLKFVVSDGKLESLTEVIIVIENVDRPIFLDTPREIIVNEGEKLTWGIDTFDPDGDEISLTVDGFPENAVLEDETLIWIPSFDEIKRKEGFLSTLLNAIRIENKILKSKTFLVSIKACSNKNCEERKVKIKVNNVNQNPIIKDPGIITLKAKEKLKLNATATDPDGDLVRYFFSEPLNERSGEWNTKRGDEGVYQVFITASDGVDQTTIPVTINVVKNNRAPKLKPKIRNLVVNEGEPVKILFKTKDPDNDSVSVSLEEPLEGSSIENNIFRWTPSYDVTKLSSKTYSRNLIKKIANINQELSDNRLVKELTFIGSDGESEDREVVKVTVKNVNRKPEIVDFLPDKEITVNIYEPVVFNIAVRDPDADKLDFEWSFSLHEPRVKGTNTIERTFVTPGRKKVKVLVTDGQERMELVWKINVLPVHEIFEEVEFTDSFIAEEPRFNVYVVDN
jgi:hypothetical protein